METIKWPPQSPDINLIENVWNHITERLGKRFPYTKIENVERLKEVLIEEWNAITPEYLDSLIRSMPARIQAIIDAKGGHIKY